MNKKLTYLENLMKLESERMFIIRKLENYEKELIKVNDKLRELI